MAQEGENLEPQAIQNLAQAAARLGETVVEVVRAGQLEAIQPLLLLGSAVWRGVRLFGLELLRLDLRLDDPREAGQLRPYDLQIESDLAFLELGVVTQTEALPGERSHLTRLFGSGMLLRPAPESEYYWLVEEVIPVNADGHLRQDDPTDVRIIQVHQGQEFLPLRTTELDEVEQYFLLQMQQQKGRFNLEELFNASRLWEDFKATEVEEALTGKDWAAAVEYLITVFDYHQSDTADLSGRYGVEEESLSDRAREIAAALRVTQFDDRYSIHPDPVAHYRELFGELGIDPRRDEEVRKANQNNRIFDSIEVPPDDETFFGPQ